MSNAPLLALTLHQPWEWAIPIYKRNETRSWSTPYRGKLAIHAGKVTDSIAISDMVRDGYPFPDHLAHGAITKIADLVDCVPTESIVDSISDDELYFGDYESGRFAWHLENILTLPEPIPCRGMQKLWTPDQTVIDQIMAIAT
ncbi:MAG: hypothetical protein HQ478_02245 [Chloroflexi bacterium]|nr:hypothetical protein [Chloroflexota bacterium]